MTAGEASFGFKSSKTTGTSTTNSTTTPIIPDFIQGPMADAYGRVHQIGQVDPASLVPDLDPLQRQAGATVGNLGQNWHWDAAAGLIGDAMRTGGPAQATAGTSVNGIQGFLNPYLDDVLNNSLAAYDHGAKETRAQQALDLAGPYRGSNAAISKAMTESRLVSGRGQLAADLRSGGYDRAANLANLQADRDQQVNLFNAGAANAFNDQRFAAANQLVNLASSYDANQRANAEAQTQQGTLFRDSAREQQRAPLDLVQWQISQYGGLPGGLFAGSNTNSSEKSKSKNSGFDLGLKIPF